MVVTHFHSFPHFFSFTQFSLFQNSNSTHDLSPPICGNSEHGHTSAPLSKTNTYTPVPVKTQNTRPSDTNSSQMNRTPLSKSTSVRSMAPLNRSDTLNFVRNDAEALQYRPFVPSHPTEAKVPPTLSKSISFGGNAKSIASNMYDDDIDFMNNYLKSLPDYNELNKKICNEQKKCADIYDKLKSINTSLQSQSNRLPKSNSFHSICTGAPAKSFAMQSISVGQSVNDIDAKNKNSLINRNATTAAATATPSSIEGVAADKFGPKPTNGSATSAVAVTAKPTVDLNDVLRQHRPLPKSASSSCVNMNMMPNDTNGSKKCLNDFWSDHLARNNQQKFGWNYNRIMANKQSPIENPPVAAIGDNNTYKLQKNMSLSQLDKRIRQDLSREELYNLICNSDQSTVNRTNAAPPSQRQPLSKSVSQTSVPSSSFVAPVKQSRKPSIPTLFKPLCKSTSNTHVFNRNYDTSDEPRETFTPKLLVKSCSSSAVFGHVPPSSHTPTSHNNHQNQNYFHPSENSTQSRILRNNELLKGVPAAAQPHQTKLFNENAASRQTTTIDSYQPTKQMLAANDFFVKQNVPQPNKVVVNYPPFKSASSAQIPLHHHNLPPAFGHPSTHYNSNAQVVQPQQIPMYSTSSSSAATITTTITTTSVGSKNNNLSQATKTAPAAAAAAAAAIPMKCKNEVNQKNELLKQPSATTPTTSTLSNLYPNKMNFIEIDSNRNAKIRPYASIATNTSTFTTFRNDGAGNGTIATVHCPPSNNEPQKFATSKPDPLEKIPRRMPAQPTAVTAGVAAIGMPAAKKLPHSFSSSSVSDLLRANASTTIPNHNRIVRPTTTTNIPTTQNQNNFTAQTLLYSRLYPNINFSTATPLHNSAAPKSNGIEGQHAQHPPRSNGQMQTTAMPYKPPARAYGLTQSKSATAISRKDTSWLERHGYEIVDMSTSMHNDEVAKTESCVLFAKKRKKKIFRAIVLFAVRTARAHSLPI